MLFVYQRTSTIGKLFCWVTQQARARGAVDVRAATNCHAPAACTVDNHPYLTPGQRVQADRKDTE